MWKKRYKPWTNTFWKVEKWVIWERSIFEQQLVGAQLSFNVRICRTPNMHVKLNRNGLSFSILVRKTLKSNSGLCLRSPEKAEKKKIIPHTEKLLKIICFSPPWCPLLWQLLPNLLSFLFFIPPPNFALVLMSCPFFPAASLSLLDVDFWGWFHAYLA